MPNYDQIFASDASRIQDKVRRLERAKGRMAALMKKMTLPRGQGFNYVSVGTLRSNPVGGAGWTNIATPDGSANNCQPDPAVVTPALNTLSYSPEQYVLKTYDICAIDGSMAYQSPEQIMNIRENFAGTIVDLWDTRSKYWYQYWSGNKIIFNSSVTTGTGTAFPNVEATYQASQELLDPIWEQIIQNGGWEEPYAYSNGQPLIPAIMSPEAHRAIIKGRSSVREDFRFAQMGKGREGSDLLQAWGVDRPYGGYMHIIDPKMPRYNFTGGVYVEVPYYTTAASSIGGDQAVVNPDYLTANFEVMYLFHPEAVVRKTPAPIGSIGSDTKFMATDYNGNIVWRNIPNATTNIFENQGFYAAQLIAAFAPTVKRQFAYSLMVKRCPAIVGQGCASY